MGYDSDGTPRILLLGLLTRPWEEDFPPRSPPAWGDAGRGRPETARRCLAPSLQRLGRRYRLLTCLNLL